MAYAILAEGRDGRELEELDAKIGMIEDPAEVAMGMLREHQAEAGLAPSSGVPGWQSADEEFR